MNETPDEQETTSGRGGRRKRGGGAEARRAAREGVRIPQRRPMVRTFKAFEILEEDALALIEDNAETLLQEIGIDFREDEEALELWKAAGADVDGERVRIPKGLCRELIKTAPEVFTQHARNPDRSVEIGGRNMVMAPVYGAPFVTDIDQGRRYATIEDFRNLVKLTYLAAPLHHSGGTVCEPVDLPVNKRHLDMVYSHIRYSDKPFMGSVTHPERAKDSVAMTEILFGKEFIDQNCGIIGLINVNSPLVYDATMLGALKVYARANQAVIIAPFILAGAMAPATVAGTVTQLFAEALAGLAFVQLCRPGAPCIFGSFVSSMSMKSGAPTMGTPEPGLVMLAAGQLARRLGVPFRTGGSLCGSKAPDAQAAYESVQSLYPTVMAGTNFILHSAGWLEAGLASSYEKFIMDLDQCLMMHTIASGIDLSDNGLAMSAFREVGPGNHFLGSTHTQANYETAFCPAMVPDNNSYEQWEAEGSRRAEQRANEIWKQWLNDYEAPPLDEAIDEALNEFMARKKEAMPDAFS